MLPPLIVVAAALRAIIDADDIFHALITLCRHATP